MTIKEAKQQKRELLKYMKENNMRRMCFMNGGLSREESRCNTEIFRLDTIIKGGGK